MLIQLFILKFLDGLTLENFITELFLNGEQFFFCNYCNLTLEKCNVEKLYRKFNVSAALFGGKSVILCNREVENEKFHSYGIRLHDL